MIMVVYAIVFLIVFDILILFLILKKDRISIKDYQIILSNIIDEREKIKKYKNQIEIFINENKKNISFKHEKMNKMIAEIDQDLERFNKEFQNQVDKSYEDMISKFDQPINFIKKNYNLLIKLNNQIDLNKNSLKSILMRCENLIKFFKNQIPYEDIIKEIEIKKYKDAKNLISSGLSKSEIKKNISLNDNELSIINNILSHKNTYLEISQNEQQKSK